MSSAGSSSPVRVLEALVTPRFVALVLLALLGLLFWVSSGTAEAGRSGRRAGARPLPATEIRADPIGAGRPV